MSKYEMMKDINDLKFRMSKMERESAINKSDLLVKIGRLCKCDMDVDNYTAHIYRPNDIDYYSKHCKICDKTLGITREEYNKVIERQAINKAEDALGNLPYKIVKDKDKKIK